MTKHSEAEPDHPHANAAMDPVVFTSRRGIAATKVSLAVFLAASLFELTIAYLSGSVALLADAAHNLGDACSSAPMWLAFRMGQRKPTRRFTYGYGRLEDMSGIFVLVLILASAGLAAFAAIHRLLHPQPIARMGVVLIAAAVSFLANESVAWIRIKTGKEIGSAALAADGYHARMDGLASVAVILGTLAVRAGYPKADPLVGLLMVPMLLKLAWESGKTVVLRLIDAVDPDVVDQISRVLREVSEVKETSDVRARWFGHHLLAEVSVAVDPDLSVRRAHQIALEARHRLLHEVKFLSDVTVHVCPMDAAGHEHRITGHKHGDFPTHAH